MGQDFDARRADHAARWGAESGAASAPAPAHNRVSLSPGPGLPAAGGPGSYNDCASAIEYGYAMARRRLRLTPVVADGSGGCQRLTVAMDEDGCWHLTVTMDGSCVSGGQ